jgi:hypothetical protein
MFDRLTSPSPDPDSARAAAGRPLTDLESEICTLAGHLAAATCRFLVLLAEFDAREGWASWDMPSCAAWLSWKCQLGSGTAREHGNVLDVGRRRRREPPPALRRALRERDECRCRFPGCHRRATQAHHIRWWLYGGITSLGNLVSLCKYHHRLIHQHGYSIATTPVGSFTFFRPDGKRIPDSPSLPEPAGLLSGEHDAEITPETIVPPWYGERLNLDYAIAVLFGNQQARAVLAA